MNDGPTSPVLTPSGQYELLPMVLHQLQQLSSEMGEHRKGIRILEGGMAEATTAIREAANEIRYVGSKLGGFVSREECDGTQERRDEERAEQRQTAVNSVVEDVDKLGNSMRELKREVCPSPAERRQRLGLWVGVAGGIVGLVAVAIAALFWFQGTREQSSIRAVVEEVLRQSKAETTQPPLSLKALASESGG